jgi:hypothetical protein
MKNKPTIGSIPVFCSVADKGSLVVPMAIGPKSRLPGANPIAVMPEGRESSDLVATFSSRPYPLISDACAPRQTIAKINGACRRNLAGTVARKGNIESGTFMFNRSKASSSHRMRVSPRFFLTIGETWPLNFGG